MIIRYTPTKYICEGCGNTISENTKFCPECGKDMRKEKIFEIDEIKVKRDRDEFFNQIGIAP